MTDVTGFGLAGHALELARGAGACVDIAWDRVPLLPQARELADAGFVTGASGRNWAGYGNEVALPEGFTATDRALLTDPQTSGGLLVSCAPEALDRVLAVFREGGFARAQAIGRLAPQAGASASLHVAS